MVPDQGWESMVPALDNGQLAWAIYALVPVLQAKGIVVAQCVFLTIHSLLSKGFKDLAKLYSQQLELMVQNCLTVFWDGGGRIRAVAQIANVSSQPYPNNYKTQGNVRV
jgi:hypothetical protein